MKMKLKRKIIGAKRSLTVWFNSVMGTAVSLFPVAESALPQLQELLGENPYKILALVIVIGNILIRGVTSQPLEQK